MVSPPPLPPSLILVSLGHWSLHLRAHCGPEVCNALSMSRDHSFLEVKISYLESGILGLTILLWKVKMEFGVGVWLPTKSASPNTRTRKRFAEWGSSTSPKWCPSSLSSAFYELSFKYFIVKTWTYIGLSSHIFIIMQYAYAHICICTNMIRLIAILDPFLIVRESHCNFYMFYINIFWVTEICQKTASFVGLLGHLREIPTLDVYEYKYSWVSA